MKNHHAFIAGVATALAVLWIARRMPRRSGTARQTARAPGATMQTGMYVPPYDTQSVSSLQ